MTRIEQLLEFIREDASDVFSQYALALEYIKLQETKAAVQSLQSVVKLNPDYVAAYYQLAQLTEKIDKEEANRIYKDGIEAATRTKNNHARMELTTAYNSFNELEE